MTVPCCGPLLCARLSLVVLCVDVTHSDTEDRWFTLGLSRDGLLLAISHTYQVSGPASARVRLISARNATRRERDQYQNLPQ